MINFGSFCWPNKLFQELGLFSLEEDEYTLLLQY